MNKDASYLHLTLANITLPKFCGRLQYDLCKTKHEIIHIANNDKELPSEEMK